jgi:hypothetical protein
MLVYRFEAFPTTIAGEWQDNSLSIAGSYLSQLYVRSASALTTFDVHVIDYAGRTIRKFITCTEVLNDITDVPVTGIVTIKILNSSVDEPYEVMACFVSD